MRQDVQVTARGAQRLDLEAEPASVPKARSFVRRVLTEWGLTEAVDTVALLTSELATNSVLHARTAFAVLVTHEEDDIRVDVLDGSAVPPRHRHNTPAAATGRGVALVASMSTAWGSTPASALQGFVKGVWFTVPVDGVEATAWDGDWSEGL